MTFSARLILKQYRWSRNWLTHSVGTISHVWHWQVQYYVSNVVLFFIIIDFEPIAGRWHCVECAKCKSCGARDPNGPQAEGTSTISVGSVSVAGGGEWHHQTRRGPGGHKVYSHSLCTPCARSVPNTRTSTLNHDSCYTGPCWSQATTVARPGRCQTKSTVKFPVVAWLGRFCMTSTWPRHGRNPDPARCNVNHALQCSLLPSAF